MIAAPARSGEWLADPGFGVYVHIPFCAHRCHYCDFNTYEGQDELHAPYVDALVAEIESHPEELPEATSVFFGGGTPTLLPPEALGRILDAVRARMGIVVGAEVTAEANPETVDSDSFERLLQEGFTRFSIGVQSLRPNVLEGLGRTHSARRALDALADARRAGADDVNLDLIYGSPWESAEDWRATLGGAIEAGPDHISAYALTVESGTPLATFVSGGRVPDIDPDVQAERFSVAENLLDEAGFARYETSNWARPHHASAHNVLYWSAGDYIAFGAGSHSHRAGRRSWRVRLPRTYIDTVARGGSTEDGHETLDPDARAGEALMLGLRLTSGINVEGFAARFGEVALATRNEEIDRSISRGLLERTNGRLKLTKEGAFVANEVFVGLL